MTSTLAIRSLWSRLLSGRPSVTDCLSVRHKSIIHPRGYKEHARLKTEDIRYKAATWHRPKLMTWEDYQNRKFRAENHKGWKRFPVWQAKMDYAENMCRLGMSDTTIVHTLDIHPHCVQYIKRKLKGGVEVLREAEYSNFVNHRPGNY